MDFRANETTQTVEQKIFAAAETGRKRGEQYATNYDYFSKKVLKLAFVTILTELILSFIFGTLDGGLFTGIGLFVGGIIVFVVNFDTELRLSISLGLFLALIGALFIIRSWKQLTKELDE